MGRQELTSDAIVRSAPRAVWNVLSDLERCPEWLANVRSIKLQGKGPIKPGMKFHLTTMVGSHEMISQVELSVVTPERRLAWNHLSDELDGKPFDLVRNGVSEFQLEPVKDGTRIRARIGFEPHGLKAKLVAALFLESRIKPELNRSLEQLKTLVET